MRPRRTKDGRDRDGVNHVGKLNEWSRLASYLSIPNTKNLGRYESSEGTYSHFVTLQPKTIYFFSSDLCVMDKTQNVSWRGQDGESL